MTVFGIVHVFMGIVATDWSCAVQFTNYGGEVRSGALTAIGRLIVFLILLKTG